MTLDERVAALETTVAALIARDERREREHTSLLQSYGELATGREQLRRDLEQDHELFTRAFDARIAELAQRSGGSDSAVIVEAARAILLEAFEIQQRNNERVYQYVNEVIEATIRQLGPAITAQVRAVIEAVLKGRAA